MTLLTRTKCRFLGPEFLASLILFLLVPQTSPGQALPGDEVDGIPNYSFAVFVGTGYYRLDDRRLFVLRMPFSWQLSEPDYDERKPGLRLLLPATAGVTNFDGFSDIPELEVDDLATVSFVPGVEIEFPLSEELAIKPFVQAGKGWDLKSSRSTFVWGVGVKARYEAQEGALDNWIFGGEILTAGNEPDNSDPNTGFSRFSAGAEYRHPLSWSLFNRRTSLHSRIVGEYYVDDLDFVPPIESIRLDYSVEFSLSLGIEPPVEYLGITMSQFGVGYKIGDDLRAITLVYTFPF